MLIPVALLGQLAATRGINQMLLQTEWGQAYVHRQYVWIQAQSIYLESIGEKGDNVYGDTGEFAASFLTGITVFINGLFLMNFILGGK